MDVNKGYYLLARTVIELALYDVRRPEICSDCGPIKNYSGVPTEYSECTKSRKFLESPMCAIWCRVAELDPMMVHKAIDGQARLTRIICKASQNMRIKNCPKLQDTPTNRVIFAERNIKGE